MGKISKYSNLYDKNGNFLHKPGNYSIGELEALIDTLDKNSREFASATAILMHMQHKEEQKLHPYDDKLAQKLIAQSKTKTTKAEIVDALNDIKDEETGKDEPGTEGCVSESAEGVGESGRGSKSNETDTTISTAA